METVTVFTVVANGGEYNDAWTNVVAASFVKAECEALIAKLKAEDQVKQAAEETIANFRLAWGEANARPARFDKHALSAWNDKQLADLTSFLTANEHLIHDRAAGYSASEQVTYEIEEIPFIGKLPC